MTDSVSGVKLLERGVGIPDLSDLITRVGPVVVVRSPMGSGKSRAFLEHISRLPPSDRALVLANRLSILRNLAGRAGDSSTLVLHSAAKSRCLARIGRLLCTIESLPRLLDEDGRLPAPYDLIVIDELPATFAQLLSPTVKDRSLAAEVFRNILSSARAVVGFAADAEPDDADTLAALAGRAVGFYENTTLPDPGTLILYRDRAEWEAELVSRLEAGKRMFVGSDSRRDLERLLKRLEPVTAGRATKLYAAGYDAETAAELADPNRSWLRYDIVAATPVITHGVDFSVENHFDFVAYLVTGLTIVPRVIIQTLRRVRHPVSAEILTLVVRDDVPEPLDPTLTSADPHRYRTTDEGRVVPDLSDPLTIVAVKAAGERVDRKRMVEEVQRRWKETGGSVVFHDDKKPKPEPLSDGELVTLGFRLDGNKLVKWFRDGETLPPDCPSGLKPGAPSLKSIRARLKTDGRTLVRLRRLRKRDGYYNLCAVDGK